MPGTPHLFTPITLRAIEARNRIGGRIHTSAVTVAVLPEADEVDAAAVKVSGEGEAMSPRQTHCVQHPLPEALATLARVFAAPNLAEHVRIELLKALIQRVQEGLGGSRLLLHPIHRLHRQVADLPHDAFPGLGTGIGVEFGQLRLAAAFRFEIGKLLRQIFGLSLELSDPADEPGMLVLEATALGPRLGQLGEAAIEPAPGELGGDGESVDPAHARPRRPSHQWMATPIPTRPMEIS